MQLLHTHNRYSIGKAKISNINQEEALNIIFDQITFSKPAYICISNARTVYACQKDERFASIENSSLITTPDGMPLVWYAHLAGAGNVERISGPDLMNTIINQNPSAGYTHYFYGSSISVISRMINNISTKVPELIILKAVSPPFRPLTSVELDELASDINLLKPNFFWVGIGAPKQEYLMAALLPKISSGTIMVGVGLAFEYLAGTVHRAPKWMRKCGLEWLYRCLQQPLRSRRFIRPFLWFLTLLLKALIHRVFLGPWNSSTNKIT